MTVVLEIDTTKSLFEPIEIKIDGKLFRVRELTLGMLEEIQKFQTETAEGSAGAIRKQLETLVEGNAEAFGKLTMSQLEKVMSVIVEKSLRPKEPEKNAQKPGATI
jgi:hypothetical protein